MCASIPKIIIILILQKREGEYNAHTTTRQGGVHFLMKTITRKKSRTVKATTAEEFDREFNRVSDEMTDDVELVWDTAEMCVHFIYEEHEKKAENASDELSLRGVHLKCKNCPHREVNPDGRKAGRKDFCPYAFLQTTRADNSACEFFCSQVLRGEIKALED